MPEPTDSVPDSPPTVRVRRALPVDADALAQLRYAFRLERRPATEGEEAFTRRCSNWMRPRLRGDSRWTAWLAERENRLIGQVWIQVIEKLPNPGPESELHAYLSNFFVLSRERNSGAGTHLLRAAVEHCRSVGVDSVFLWPTERSVALYRRAGFEPPSDLLVMELREPKHR